VRVHIVSCFEWQHEFDLKVVIISVCLSVRMFVCPIITHEFLDILSQIFIREPQG